MMNHLVNQIAYIDPGSGALFLQMLIAGCASAVFAFRTKLGRLFGRKH